MGQEAGREGPAVRKAEDAVEGAFLFDGLREQVIGFHDGLVVVLHRSGPLVEAEVGTFVESTDSGTGWRFDFALYEMEGGRVVFLEVSSQGGFR